MSNNLVLKNNADLNKLNKNYGDDLYELHIRVRNQKTKDGRTFKKIDCKMFLPVYEDVASGELTTKQLIGKLNRWVSVHFRKDAWKNVADVCSAKSIEDLQSGSLFVRKKSVKAPREYYVEHEIDENGKDVANYPELWIHGDICGFIPYVPDDEIFMHHDQNGQIVQKTLVEESEDVGFEQNEEEG